MRAASPVIERPISLAGTQTFNNCNIFQIGCTELFYLFRFISYFFAIPLFYSPFPEIHQNQHSTFLLSSGVLTTNRTLSTITTCTY